MPRLREHLKPLLRTVFRVASEDVPCPTLLEHERLGFYQRVDQGTQVLLRLKYQEMVRRKEPLPIFDDVQFRSFSQNGEDGILLYIFSLVGTTNKRVVEICAGDGVECNAANLIINHGWRGLLFDGDEGNISRGRAFYARHKDTWISPPQLVQAWITRDNIDRLISEHGFAGEIDLLSLDIDGNDYWVWEAIECARPRVVVVEHNSFAGPEVSATIPYREDFVADVSQSPPYLGATLPAFVKLARRKGYRLVGGERLGFNAFFVRDGLGEVVLPEVEAAAVAGVAASAAGLEMLRTREFVEV
ncbi:MAG: hypothetical protein QOE33_1401 [Acidobacteriota bacterium]|nr:hypothetical protein [Acidobacteriota bacterium]